MAKKRGIEVKIETYPNSFQSVFPKKHAGYSQLHYDIADIVSYINELNSSRNDEKTFFFISDDVIYFALQQRRILNKALCR